MTKPISRKMAVDCLLYRFEQDCYTIGDSRAFLSCGICRLSIQQGQDIQFDHIHADVHGGPHEYQNLRPVHAECHKLKTAKDIKANAKVKRLRGETKTGPKKKIPSRPWPKRAA